MTRHRGLLEAEPFDEAGRVGSLSVFGIFRCQDGRIAEHEDVLQEVPTATDSEDVFATLSHPQTSSPGQRWLTSYNKQLVTAYVDQLPFRKDVTAVDAYVGSEYHSHCTAAPDTRGRAVVGLFRVRGQKTVEHWLAGQNVPEASANDSTML